MTHQKTLASIGRTTAAVEFQIFPSDTGMRWTTCAGISIDAALEEAENLCACARKFHKTVQLGRMPEPFANLAIVYFVALADAILKSVIEGAT